MSNGAYDKAKLEGEWFAIQATDFWKEMVRRILNRREFLINKCLTLDDPRREQGEVRGIDYILGLPEAIIRQKEEED